MITLQQIKKQYAEFDKELHDRFLFVVRDTEKGTWGPSDMDAVYSLFREIHLDKANNFLDVGCGDGRVVLIASLFTDAYGIEMDQALLNKGNEIISRLNANAHLLRKDFFTEDWSGYDVIFSNPDTGFHNGMEDKLLKELNGRLYVYNNIFMPRFLKGGKTYWFNQVPITEFSKPR